MHVDKCVTVPSRRSRLSRRVKLPPLINSTTKTEGASTPTYTPTSTH